MHTKRIHALSQLIEQMSRQIHAAGHVEELYPAQWAALRYFANTPAKNSTVIALARYQSTAIPPVSRTVATLISKGLVHKVGRIPGQKTEIIAATAAGEKMLERDPMLRISKALDTVAVEDFEAAARVIEAVIRALSKQPAGDEPDSSGMPQP